MARVNRNEESRLATREAVKPLGFKLVVACKYCGSASQRVLNSELAIDCPDFQNPNMPFVYVCGRIIVCLVCGFAELTIPELELEIEGVASTSQDSRGRGSSLLSRRKWRQITVLNS